MLAALEKAWAALVPAGSPGMDQQMYWDIGRKLYLYLTLGEPPDPWDCQHSVGKDWNADSNGDGVLDFHEFSKAWFQLADINTEGISPEVYSSWLIEATDNITEPASRPSTQQRRKLRLSRELLECSLDEAEIDDVSERAHRVCRWQEVLHEGGRVSAVEACAAARRAASAEGDSAADAETAGAAAAAAAHAGLGAPETAVAGIVAAHTLKAGHSQEAAIAAGLAAAHAMSQHGSAAAVQAAGVAVAQAAAMGHSVEAAAVAGTAAAAAAAAGLSVEAAATAGTAAVAATAAGLSAEAAAVAGCAAAVAVAAVVVAGISVEDVRAVGRAAGCAAAAAVAAGMSVEAADAAGRAAAAALTAAAVAGRSVENAGAAGRAAGRAAAAAIAAGMSVVEALATGREAAIQRDPIRVARKVARRARASRDAKQVALEAKKGALETTRRDQLRELARRGDGALVESRSQISHCPVLALLEHRTVLLWLQAAWLSRARCRRWAFAS